MNLGSLTFRPITPEDMPFLYRVYASTRMEELAPVPWPEQAKAAFLASQFSAQHNYYHQQFPDALYLVIMQGETPVGRLYREWRGENLHILDIALLPEYRNHGIGTQIMQDLISEAAAKNCGVSIFVEVNNPARRWYDRLGFREFRLEGIYCYMERPSISTRLEY